MGNEVFAERICQLRKAKDWTLERLGNEVGLGKTTVLNWEKSGAVPNEEVLRKLSSLFEVPIDYLLGSDVTNFKAGNADLDDDGNINIADVTTLIDFLLSNGN